MTAAARLLVAGAFFAGSGCGDIPRHTGSSHVESSLQGLAVGNQSGGAIALSDATRIRLGTTELTCETTHASDNLTIDLATATVGTFHVVPDYPALGSLAPLEARAHACPASATAPCHNLVQSGTVTITSVDASLGGHVEGTFALSFTDGSVSGSFSAIFCGDGATD